MAIGSHISRTMDKCDRSHRCHIHNDNHRRYFLSESCYMHCERSFGKLHIGSIDLDLLFASPLLGKSGGRGFCDYRYRDV